MDWGLRQLHTHSPIPPYPNTPTNIRTKSSNDPRIIPHLAHRHPILSQRRKAKRITQMYRSNCWKQKCKSESSPHTLFRPNWMATPWHYSEHGPHTLQCMTIYRPLSTLSHRYSHATTIRTPQYEQQPLKLTENLNLTTNYTLQPLHHTSFQAIVLHILKATLPTKK